MVTNENKNKKSTTRPKSDFIKHSDTGSGSRGSGPKGRATSTPPAPAPGHKR